VKRSTKNRLTSIAAKIIVWTVTIVLTVLFVGSILFLIDYSGKVECIGKGEIMDVHSEWHGKLGCYLELNGQMVPEDQWQYIYDRKE
jgi:hypothetical protein